MINWNNTNSTTKSIIKDCVLAFLSLFVNGFGIYLTILADIGAGPWDVLGLGVSNTFHIIYGNAAIIISLTILLVDIVLKEPIGIAMIIDTLTVGKAVDFFNWLGLIKSPKTIAGSIVMMIIGLFIMAYTQYIYMYASLGCGPRDTLLVGLKKHLDKFPIGVISIILLSLATFGGYLLGGKVGIGTLICAFGCGPIMELVFKVVHFDAAKIRHQNIKESLKILLKR